MLLALSPKISSKWSPTFCPDQDPTPTNHQDAHAPRSPHISSRHRISQWRQRNPRSSSQARPHPVKANRKGRATQEKGRASWRAAVAIRENWRSNRQIWVNSTNLPLKLHLLPNRRNTSQTLYLRMSSTRSLKLLSKRRSKRTKTNL